MNFDLRRTSSTRRRRPRRAASAALVLLAAIASTAVFAQNPQAANEAQRPTLESARLKLDKWIETEQIISKERKEWQQGKEILAGRVELVKQEVSALEEKLQQAETGVGQAQAKKDELAAERERLVSASAALAAKLGAMEADVRKLFKSLPEPVRSKLAPLIQRLPEDPAATKASIAERFQNVLGILNEVNKSNGEITPSYEVHTLADGKPAEVRVVYVGLAAAFYLSASGEAGVGRPGDDGWHWEARKDLGEAVSTALEILQGKHSPAFVPLPVKLR